MRIHGAGAFGIELEGQPRSAIILGFETQIGFRLGAGQQIPEYEDIAEAPEQIENVVVPRKNENWWKQAFT
jgi:hypothetical protein